MYSLRTPAWTDHNGKFHFGQIMTVELVDTLRGGVKPSPDLVLEYYGEGAPESVYNATRYDRLVFFDSWDDDFIVVPASPRNKGLWSKIA